MGSRYADFAECVQTSQGFITRHKETFWQYTEPKSTEEEAWQELDQLASKLGRDIDSLLEVSSSVTI